MKSVLLVMLAGCGDDPTAREAFESDVVGVLERSCSASNCHGVAPESEDKGEVSTGICSSTT